MAAPWWTRWWLEGPVSLSALHIKIILPRSLSPVQRHSDRFLSFLEMTDIEVDVVILEVRGEVEVDEAAWEVDMIGVVVAGAMARAAVVMEQEVVQRSVLS